ncbi:MAG: lysophospholipid acyltransferase family protein [Alphaproteobacteria bacterium]
MITQLFATTICNVAKLITGMRAVWCDAPGAQQRIYYANHRSHSDFLLIWASLPSEIRAVTRPVAAADYWLKGSIRSYFITKVFRAVLIERNSNTFPPSSNPLERMDEALTSGESLIMFPEGTRNLEDDLLPFKAGIYHLAKAHPQTEIVPVWLENLGRVMPKGKVIPVPLLCSLTFGSPLTITESETKETFLARARDALIALAPQTA